MPRIVSNSTPLIAFAKIKRFHLLRELFNQIHIPAAVYDEVVNAGYSRAGAAEVENSDWIFCHQVKNIDLVSFLRISLDAGEAEAIALAKESKADLLLIDDSDGRNIAGSVDLNLTGTVGILLRYYQGCPDDFKEALDELLMHGFRLNDQVYQKIIGLA
jgi:hypothetical protein